MREHLSVILAALHERRNRLIALDLGREVNQSAVLNLRARIKECNAAIIAVEQEVKASA